MIVPLAATIYTQYFFSKDVNLKEVT